MMSRWLFPRTSKRKRFVAAKLSSVFRLESLEQRNCMAGNLEVSPAVNEMLAIPSHFQQTDYVAKLARSTDQSEKVCSLTTTVDRFSFRVGRCTNDFSGQNRVLAYFMAEIAFSNSFSPDRLSGSEVERALNNTEDGMTANLDIAVTNNWSFNPQAVAEKVQVDMSDSSRPTISTLPQRDVGEGEGPMTDAKVNGSIGTDTTPPSGKGVSKLSASTEEQTIRRDRSSGAAIDWTIGAKTEWTDREEPTTLKSSTNQANAISSLQDPSSISVETDQSPPSSWTALQPIRAANLPAQSGDLNARPHLSLLPGIDIEADAPRNGATTDKAIEGHLISYSQLDDEPQPLPILSRQSLPWTMSEAMPAVLTDEANAFPLRELLPVDDEDEEEEQVPLSRSSSPSKLWCLAAIPALLALPRNANLRRRGVDSPCTPDRLRRFL